MAGKVQHEIPRLYQRGFLIQDTGEAERIFVFRKDRSYPSNIDRSGAESNFYSRPSGDGSRTLDDHVTEYEGGLSGLVRELRSSPAGARVDGHVAGEVIAHLTTRNAHLRGAFAHGFRTIARGAVDIFGDEDNVRRLIGIDTPWVSDRFRERIAGVVAANPQVAALGIDPVVLERAIFASVREGFSPLFQTQMPAFTAFAELIAEHADEQVRDAHNEALSKTFAPEPRIEDLASFTWQKLETKFELILPDCVAVALETDGSVHPLMMADHDHTNVVLLPLTSRTLLVGTRTEEDFDPATFNGAAASCSHRYFLAASHTPMMVELSNSIGARSVLVVETAIGESLAEFAPGSPKPAEALLSGMPQQPLTIPVSFTGNFDEPTMEGITDWLRALLGELAWTIPLDRLDGISFADDYPAALAALDIGIPDVKQPETRQDNVGVGIGQTPTVLREEVLKSHVVVVSHVGRALASNNEDDRKWASAVLARLVAQAGVLQIVDETLPGVMLNRRCQDMEADLQRCSYCGWNAYFFLTCQCRV